MFVHNPKAGEERTGWNRVVQDEMAALSWPGADGNIGQHRPPQIYSPTDPYCRFVMTLTACLLQTRWVIQLRFGYLCFRAHYTESATVAVRGPSWHSVQNCGKYEASWMLVMFLGVAVMWFNDFCCVQWGVHRFFNVSFPLFVSQCMLSVSFNLFPMAFPLWLLSCKFSVFSIHCSLYGIQQTSYY